MPADDRAEQLALIAARAAADKLGDNIVALDVSDQLALTDVFVLISGESERQIQAIVDAVDEAMREAGSKILRREGITELRWVLLDYGDIIVHIQHQEDREFYSLDRLWKDCPIITIPPDPRAEAGLGAAVDPDSSRSRMAEREGDISS